MGIFEPSVDGRRIRRRDGQARTGQLNFRVTERTKRLYYQTARELNVTMTSLCELGILLIRKQAEEVLPDPQSRPSQDGSYYELIDRW